MIDCPSSSSKSLYATQTVLCVGGGPSPIMPLMCAGGSASGRTPMILQQLLCLAHNTLATVSHIISRASFSKRCRPVFDAIGLCMQGKLTQGECKATEAAWTACAQEWQQHNAMRRQRVHNNPRVVAQFSRRPLPWVCPLMLLLPAGGSLSVPQLSQRARRASKPTSDD